MRGGLVEAKHALWASWDVGWRDLRRCSIAIGATGHEATSYRKLVAIGLGMTGGVCQLGTISFLILVVR